MMRAAILLTLTLTLTLALALACGPGSAQIAERDRCYDDAEAAAQRRIEAECPGAFQSCDALGSILDELQLAQERCR